MTIQSATIRVSFSCNGTTTIFPVNIQAYQATDFLVTLTTAAGVESNLVLNSDYSLTQSGSLSPTYWTLACINPTVWPSGATVQAFLNPAQTQQTQYVQGQAFPSAAVQANFDRLTQMVLRLQDQVSRSIRAPDGDVTPGMLLPPALMRALQYLACDANGNLIATTALPGTSNTPAALGAMLNPVTAAEVTAGVTPTNQVYPELDVRRYGALAANSGAQNATAIQQAVSVLAQKSFGELLIPQGLVLNLTQVQFNSMTNFSIRCDGVIVSSATQPGTPFTDQRSTFQGQFSPLKINACTGFKVHGSGSINPGYVEPAFITNCSDWEWSLDCIGTGLNSTLAGFWTQFCDHFSVHDCRFDTITAQNMNNVTEQYYDWLENVFFLSDSEFKVYGVTSRRAGMCGLYFGSDCTQFSVSNCLCEYNSGSGMQFTWSSYGTNPPTYYTVENCVTQYNQADGFDIANTSGTQTPIFASFIGCIHTYNGWINCNPANAAGADGSGVGTCTAISNFEIIGCNAYECAQAGIFMQTCANWKVIGCEVLKTNAGTQAEGAFISGLNNGLISGCDIKVTNTLPALAMQSTSDVKLKDSNFDGLMSIANGTYTGCAMEGCKVTCYNTFDVQFDLIGCNVIVSNATQDGLFLVQSHLHIVRNIVSATNHGISNTGANYCDISWNNVTTSGAGEAILINAANSCNVYGNTVSAQAGAGVHLFGVCDSTTLAMNIASSVSGNSLRVESTCTSTNKWANIGLVGATSYAGSFGINF